MKKDKLAVQLYTVRDFLKTREDVVASLKKIKEIGFDAVQMTTCMVSMPEAELASMLSDAGLLCCATQEPGKMIVEEPGKVAARLLALGCKHTAYPYPHCPLESESDYVELAKNLNSAGRVLAEAGLLLSYHNHALEFERFGKRSGLEIIYDETDPACVQGEIDTYWVQHGGCDPVAWCKKLSGRLPLIHLKEFGILNGQISILEIGSGNLDWRKIISAASEAGTEWFIIEQDICRIDPFESLRMSFEYLLNEL
ncbi:MAG: hypothetical protein A2X49_15885 [Lentisphaerae bacterium GWF2_52_8]|nr:MAG: hypothetical protein A2X49_15885 [Lentisphaerae bacterium GWF2_52_8]